MKKISIDRYQNLLNNPTFQSWLTYQYYPYKWVDNSWFQRLIPINNQALLKASNTQPWLIKQFSIDKIDWNIFENSMASFLFAPKKCMFNVFSTLGALCYSLNLNKIIEKQCRQQLFALFSQDTLHYIQHTGPLLLNKQPALFEEVTQKTQFWNCETQQLINFHSIGHMIFQKVLLFEFSQNKMDGESKIVDAWQHYYKLKLSCNEEVAMSHSFLDIDLPANEQIKNLVIKIVRHLEPQCLTLFS